MTSATTRRRRRLALMAATTAAAMVLLPGTAMANPLTDVLDGVTEMTESVTGGGNQAPDADVPSGVVPEVAGPALVPDAGDPTTKAHLGEEPTEDDDSDGHETEDPSFPDHGSGEVGNVELGDPEDPTEIADVTEYDATIEDDDSTSSDVTVLGLFGQEIFGSHADSGDGPNEEGENPTAPLCEGSGGALCLSLLYSDAFADQEDGFSSAGARGGVAALCVGGDDPESTTAAECSGPISAGAGEGMGLGARNDDGNTATLSTNELASLCLGGSEDDDDNAATVPACGGLGLQALHSDSYSFADDETAGTERDSYLLGFDAQGERMKFGDDNAGSCLPPTDDAEAFALLCLFVNQGESFLFPNGAASATEALHLDLLRSTPIAVLTELGKAETVARDFDDDGCDPGNPDGPCPEDPEDPKDPKDPECDDAVDNDGDGDIDFPADSDCESPEDDNEGPDDGDDNGKPECSDGVDNDDDGHTDFGDDPDCDSDEDDSEAGDDGNGAGDGDGDGDGLAFTGADISPLLAGAFLLIGLGALTVAATRRRTGNQSS